MTINRESRSVFLDKGTLPCRVLHKRASVRHAKAFSLPPFLDGLVQVFHHAHASAPQALEVYLPPLGFHELFEKEDIGLVCAHLSLQSFEGFPLQSRERRRRRRRTGGRGGGHTYWISVTWPARIRTRASDKCGREKLRRPFVSYRTTYHTVPHTIPYHNIP